MSKREHMPPPSGNVVKCFCALVVTAKRPVDELFRNYFHNLLSASRGFAPRLPPRMHPGPRWETFVPRHTPQTTNLPTLKKNPADAHGVQGQFLTTHSTVECSIERGSKRVSNNHTLSYTNDFHKNYFGKIIVVIVDCTEGNLNIRNITIRKPSS